MQSSKGVYKLIRPVGLVIRIEGRIYNKVLNAFLRCDINPILWRKFFRKIANGRNNVYSGPNTFNKHRRERQFHNFNSCKSIIKGCI